MVTVAVRANFGGYEAGNASTGNVQPLVKVEDVFRPAEPGGESHAARVRYRAQCRRAEGGMSFHGGGLV